MIIDHDPNEVPRKRSLLWDPPGLYWLNWAIVALLWLWAWYFRTFDWEQIALGFFTGCVLATWAIEITGNKIPDSWRDTPPRRD